MFSLFSWKETPHIGNFFKNAPIQSLKMLNTINVLYVLSLGAANMCTTVAFMLASSVHHDMCVGVPTG